MGPRKKRSLAAGGGGGGGGGGASGDTANGEKVFKTLCAACHSLSVSLCL